METTNNVVQQLIGERQNLKAQMEALRNQIEGLEIAIQLISKVTTPSAEPDRARARVSETIVSILADSREVGLRPKDIIDRAMEIGISLNRGSVYALLNRMERTETITRQDGRYKLASSPPERGDTGAGRLREMLADSKKLAAA
jgi:hypothetical protein